MGDLSRRSNVKPKLLNDFVGAGEQHGWHFEADGFGCLEIDHELELRRLLHR